jgi:hypothetical protein
MESKSEQIIDDLPHKVDNKKNEIMKNAEIVLSC